MQFGTEVEFLSDISGATADPDVEAVKDVNEAVYITAGGVLDESNSLSINLPMHMKCIAHTFKSVLSVVFDRSLDSVSFKSIYKKAMPKVFWVSKS